MFYWTRVLRFFLAEYRAHTIPFIDREHIYVDLKLCGVCVSLCACMTSTVHVCTQSHAQLVWVLNSYISVCCTSTIHRIVWFMCRNASKIGMKNTETMNHMNWSIERKTEQNIYQQNEFKSWTDPCIDQFEDKQNIPIHFSRCCLLDRNSKTKRKVPFTQ